MCHMTYKQMVIRQKIKNLIYEKQMQKDLKSRWSLFFLNNPTLCRDAA